MPELFVSTTCCCGIDWLDGIDAFGQRDDYAHRKFKTPEAFVLAARIAIAEGGDTGDTDTQPFYMFNTVTKYKGKKKIYRHGETIAEYIKKNKLGECTSLPSKVNFRHGNTIKPFIWSVNKSNFEKWKPKNKDLFKKYITWKSDYVKPDGGDDYHW